MTSINEQNRYRPSPQQKRKAYRGYIKGTHMTVKKPGDLLFTEAGECFIINRRGCAIRKENGDAS